MGTIRWGLLSTANINKRLIPAIRMSKRGELVTVASRDEQNAKTYAMEWEIPTAFGSYEEMITSGSIDAVYISLPNHLHAEWSVRAMSEGLHVLCEKPLALSVEEVDQMIAASELHQRVLAEAFMYRHHPQTRLAGEWVRSGKLGDICLVRGVFNIIVQKQHNIRLVPEYGGGCLWYIGVYPLSFAQFIMESRPTWVSGAQWIGETGVDETFAGLLHYENGRFATIGASFRTPFYTSAEIIGTEGRLVFTRPFVIFDETRRMVFHPRDGEPREIAVPDKELYLGQVDDMHTAILDGKPSYISLEETRKHIQTVEALYESAQVEQIVHLE